MDFTWDHETVEFRKQVRAFLHGETGIAGTDGTEVALRFQSKLAKLGWLTMAWPREYGGGAASHLRQLVYNEEMSYADAPSVNHGVQWVGPTLMLHGSEEQRERYLPPIARAEEFWCTLYSEPGAGSDLASLQTRAVSSDDDFIINGQKIWTGRAHYARYGWLAARTDPEAPKHRGITLFIVDMQSPGVSIRPLLDLSGRHHFNEVFFDDVHVPRANIVGELNRGWYYIAVALDFERSGIQNFATARRVVEQLAATPAARRPLAPVLRHELAERAIEVAVGTNLAYRVALMQARGELPNQESSASRVFGTELIQRTALTAMRIAGMCGQVRAPLPFGGRDVATPYLVAASETIAGGTSEIQRNIIATRGLGLPRA